MCLEHVMQREMLIGRSDDKEEKVARRYRIYVEQVFGIIDYFDCQAGKGQENT